MYYNVNKFVMCMRSKYFHRSLDNGRKSARRAVSLNDKDLKINVSKYKLQTSRSLKVIRHLNIHELENQKITEEKVSVKITF